jgi:hypothetical protein
LEVKFLAWTLALAALPEVIENIDTVMMNIDELSGKWKTPKQELQKQKDKLSQALSDLKKSISQIGYSIRYYEQIYAALIDEKTTAETVFFEINDWVDANILANNLSLKDFLNDSSIKASFQMLRKSDLVLTQQIASKKGIIEEDDYEKIDKAKRDVDGFFNNAETKLNTKLWKEACQDIYLINKKLGTILSILDSRFTEMSRKLIDIQTLPITPEQFTLA